MSAKELAQALLNTAKAYEENFDTEKAEQLKAEYESQLKEVKGFDVPISPRYELCYKVSLQATAIAKAGDLAMPVFLLLNSSWNEALDWAKKIVR